MNKCVLLAVFSAVTLAALRNLKTGGPAAQPVNSRGRFEWSSCANVPALDGMIVFPPPPGMLLIFK